MDFAQNTSCVSNKISEMKNFETLEFTQRLPFSYKKLGSYLHEKIAQPLSSIEIFIEIRNFEHSKKLQKRSKVQNFQLFEGHKFFEKNHAQ